MSSLRRSTLRPGIGTALILYAASAPSLVAAVILARSYTFGGEGIGFGRALLWQGTIYFAWAGSALLIAWAGRRWRRGRNVWLSPAAAYTIAGLLLVPANTLLFAATTWLLRPVPASGRPPVGESIRALFLDRLPISVLIFSAIIAVIYALDHYRAMRQRELATAALEVQLARAQLDALTAQLRPHFLFNALQAIATLVRARPDDAIHMTVRLGDLLRETLARPDAHEVPLADELRVLTHYLAIEQVRFGDRLRLNMEIPPDTTRLAVPRLLLQPLVENAIRHGLAPRPQGGEIVIAAAQRDGTLTIVVRDTGVGANGGGGVASASNASGIGLANTRERLAHLYPHNHRLTVESSSGGTTVTISIPARE